MSSAVDTRTLVTVLACAITALTSGLSGTPATIATSLITQTTSSAQSAATGLTNQEVAILTMLSSAVVSTQPSSSAHNMF